MPVEPKRRDGQTHLSGPELKLRGRIAIERRWGRDATGLRHAFDELQAARQLREAAERLVAARQAQGFPDKVTDAATLARIATLIADPGKVPA